MTRKAEQPITSRPYFSHLHLHEWEDRLGNRTPGIAVRKGRLFAAHLTAAEAIQLANKLADLVEKMERHDA